MSTRAKCKDGFELAAFSFVFAPHTKYDAICFRYIHHFQLHGKSYSDPQLLDLGGKTVLKHRQIVTAKNFNPQKALSYANPRLLSHFRIFHPLAGARSLIPSGPKHNHPHSVSCQMLESCGYGWG